MLDVHGLRPLAIPARKRKPEPSRRSNRGIMEGVQWADARLYRARQVLLTAVPRS